MWDGKHYGSPPVVNIFKMHNNILCVVIFCIHFEQEKYRYYQIYFEWKILSLNNYHTNVMDVNSIYTLKDNTIS